MTIVEITAGVVVAVGTITAGIKFAVTSIYDRGRKAEREESYKAKMEADLEELRKLLGRE